MLRSPSTNASIISPSRQIGFSRIKTRLPAAKSRAFCRFRRFLYLRFGVPIEFGESSPTTRKRTMDSILVKKSHRQTIRRAVRSECTAFATNEYREIGTGILDLSPQGTLVACNQPIEIGDPIMLFFRAPGDDELWLDAEAEVSRIVHGMRRYDRGCCMGLRFTYLERPDRKHLTNRLVGYPPPIPKRRPKVDYAESVRRFMQDQTASRIVSKPIRWPTQTASRPIRWPSKIVQLPSRFAIGRGFNEFMSLLKTKIELRHNRAKFLKHVS